MDARRTAAIVGAALLLGGCAGGGPSPAGTGASARANPPASEAARSGSETPDGQRYPDIVEVEITPAGEDAYDLAVTVSSPYDSPERYADGWRVIAPDGTVLGTHTLLHDHAGEQPFTRTQTGVEIPAAVEQVTVEGRDRRHGYGGATVTVEVPRNGG